MRLAEGRREVAGESVALGGLEYIVLDAVPEVLAHSLVEGLVLLPALLTTVGNAVAFWTVGQLTLLCTVAD